MMKMLLLQRPKKRTADTDTDAEQERLFVLEDKDEIALYLYCT